MTVLGDLVTRLAGAEKQWTAIPAETYRLAMAEILRGQAPMGLVAAFLTAQALRPPTAAALVGSVEALQEHVVPVSTIPQASAERLVDIVGTGGDGLQTFNISTMAAIVAAAAGALVAKHGNRSASSRSGSADCLENLGVSLEISPTLSLEKTRLAFLFAPRFHPVLKRVAPLRKQLRFRTLFNQVGPLVNPAQAPYEVLGVYSRPLMEPMAETLLRLGKKKAWVVHGEDGADELSLTGPTTVIELAAGQLKEFTLDPRDYGFSLCRLEDLKGGDPRENAKIGEKILQGESGPRRDCVILNAAAGLWVSECATSFEAGVRKAKDSLQNRSALAVLEGLRALS